MTVKAKGKQFDYRPWAEPLERDGIITRGVDELVATLPEYTRPSESIGWFPDDKELRAAIHARLTGRLVTGGSAPTPYDPSTSEAAGLKHYRRLEGHSRVLLVIMMVTLRPWIEDKALEPMVAGLFPELHPTKLSLKTCAKYARYLAGVHKVGRRLILCPEHILQWYITLVRDFPGDEESLAMWQKLVKEHAQGGRGQAGRGLLAARGQEDRHLGTEDDPAGAAAHAQHHQLEQRVPRRDVR